MPGWQYELYSPFNLALLILKVAVPVLLVGLLIGGMIAISATPKKSKQPKPAGRRVGVAEYLAAAAAQGAGGYEVTGRLRVRRDGDAWLESTEAQASGDAPAPRLRLNSKTMTTILANIPDHGDPEFRIDAYAWFKGRPAVIEGEPALSTIAEGSIFHDGQQYGFELLRG